jgi:hypothetical protein
MGDLWLESMLTHTVAVYHLDSTTALDGQVIEGYPAAPDIAALACAIHMDGKLLAQSSVGYLIESDAILYCEDAPVMERDKIVWGTRIFYVNGTPSRYHDLLGATPSTPHLLEVGLREEKDAPA